MTPQIVTGDNVALSVTLKKNNATFVIDSGATVKASLVSFNHSTSYTLEITQSAAATGADWANSLVIVEFAPGDTSAITYQGKAYLEIQVDDTVQTSGKLTFFAEVVIVTGTIT